MKQMIIYTIKKNGILTAQLKLVQIQFFFKSCKESEYSCTISSSHNRHVKVGHFCIFFNTLCDFIKTKILMIQTIPVFNTTITSCLPLFSVVKRMVSLKAVGCSGVHSKDRQQHVSGSRTSHSSGNCIIKPAGRARPRVI